MVKVLFVPMNSIQAETYLKVFDSLKGKNVECVFLSLDYFYKKRYPNYLVEPVFIKNSIKFKTINDYKSSSPIKIFNEEKPDIIINSQDAMEPFIRIMTEHVRKKSNALVIVLQDAFMFQLGPPYNSPEQDSSGTLLKKINAVLLDVSYIFTILDYGNNWRERFSRILSRLAEIIKGTSTRWGDGAYDFIAVSGDYTKKMLISQGISESRIVITGQPRWDELTPSNYDRNILCAKYGLDPKSRIVLFTTQPLVESKMWTEEEREFFIVNIISRVKSLKDFVVLLKLHPRDNRNDYEEILRMNNLYDDAIIFQNEPIHELIGCCDVMLTHICTTALEAMLLKKPVIAVDFKNTTKGVPYVDAEAALGVDNPEDLKDTINSVLFDDATRKNLCLSMEKFVYECAFIQDGKSAKRVAELILTHAGV